jgi:hypothetical protein
MEIGLEKLNRHPAPEAEPPAGIEWPERALY